MWVDQARFDSSKYDLIVQSAIRLYQVWLDCNKCDWCVARTIRLYPFRLHLVWLDCIMCDAILQGVILFQWARFDCAQCDWSVLSAIWLHQLWCGHKKCDSIAPSAIRLYSIWLHRIRCDWFVPNAIWLFKVQPELCVRTRYCRSYWCSGVHKSFKWQDLYMQAVSAASVYKGSEEDRICAVAEVCHVGWLQATPKHYFCLWLCLRASNYSMISTRWKTSSQVLRYGKHRRIDYRYLLWEALL